MRNPQAEEGRSDQLPQTASACLNCALTQTRSPDSFVTFHLQLRASYKCRQEDTILGHAPASTSIETRKCPLRWGLSKEKRAGTSGHETPPATPLGPYLLGSRLLSQSVALVSPLALSHLNSTPVLGMNVITHWANQSIHPPPLLINSSSLCRADLKE